MYNKPLIIIALAIVSQQAIQATWETSGRLYAKKTASSNCYTFCRGQNKSSLGTPLKNSNGILVCNCV